jgi:hypothetical protein
MSLYNQYDVHEWVLTKKWQERLDKWLDLVHSVMRTTRKLKARPLAWVQRAAWLTSHVSFTWSHVSFMTSASWRKTSGNDYLQNEWSWRALRAINRTASPRAFQRALVHLSSMRIDRSMCRNLFMLRVTALISRTKRPFPPCKVHSRTQ